MIPILIYVQNNSNPLVIKSVTEQDNENHHQASSRMSEIEFRMTGKSEKISEIENPMTTPLIEE